MAIYTDRNKYSSHDDSTTWPNYLRKYLHRLLLLLVLCLTTHWVASKVLPLQVSAASVHNSQRLNRFCPTNQPGIVNGVHNRLVGEGGRIALTCCLSLAPGRQDGMSRARLLWINPKGQGVVNYFHNPSIGPGHYAYSIPDYRWIDNFLMSILVVQNFRPSDAGPYQCQFAYPADNFSSSSSTSQQLPTSSSPSITTTTTTVTLDLRPRLLADYTPLPPVIPEHSSGSALAIGEPVSVGLEEEREAVLSCRINPNFSSSLVHITWYFQGRQLVRPSSAVQQQQQQQQQQLYSEPPTDNSSSEFDWGSRGLVNTKSLMDAYRSGEGSIVGVSGHDNGETVDRYGGILSGVDQLKSIWLDPSELDILIEDNGQTLRLRKAQPHHAGQYLCKAEAFNPDSQPSTTSQASPFNPAEQEGSIDSTILIQLQAIRAVVFSRPRLLPGNPFSLVPSPDHLMLSSNPHRRWRFHRSTIMNSRQPMNHLQQPAQEGGQLMLECSARGKPHPDILWFRGGMGSFPQASRDALTFDQRVREALSQLELVDVERQLGVLIARGSQLIQTADNQLLNASSMPINGIDQEWPSKQQQQSQWSSSRFGSRFELYHRLRKDDIGNPVISVSRLIINEVQPSDATRYTCLALLDLAKYGGSGNYTDVGSIIPDIIFHPRFVRPGTSLHVSANPGEEAHLTCEAYGGKQTPRNRNGLHLRLLRGPGVPRLLNLLSQSREVNGSSSGDNDLELVNEQVYGSVDQIQLPESSSPVVVDFAGGVDEYDSTTSDNDGVDGEVKRSTKANLPPQQHKEDTTTTARLGLIDGVEIVDPYLDPRYHLTVEADPVNPYASILQLTISDLKPEDNAFYACEAISGHQWRAIAPTGNEPAGRLTVWFAPVNLTNRNAVFEGQSSSDLPVTYGLAHLPSRLICEAYGQPTPVWSWYGPQFDSESLPLGDSASSLQGGYMQHDSQDGEASVSELLVPAAFWNAGLFGTYTCLASNRLGNATGHVRLKLATHPGRPGLRACKVELSVIELCVQPPTTTGGLPMTHYELRIQAELNGPFHGPFVYLPGPRVLRLANLLAGQQYRFALSAASVAGRGPNAYMTVQTYQQEDPVFEIMADNKTVESTAFTLEWLVGMDEGKLAAKAGETGVEGQKDYSYVVRVRSADPDRHLPTGQSVGRWKSHVIDNPDCHAMPDGQTKKCTYKLTDLRPGSAYELELESRRSGGGAPDQQKVQFRTATRDNTTEGGILLSNRPASLRSTAGANNASPHQFHRVDWLYFFAVVFVMNEFCRDLIG